MHFFVHTCPQREPHLDVLLKSLSASDIGTFEVRVCREKGLARVESWMLEQLDELTRAHEFVVRLEDDIVVSPHIRHNLTTWPALRCPSFGIGLGFRFAWYSDAWTSWRIDAHTASLYAENRYVAGAQVQVIRSATWGRIRAHLPRNQGSMMDLGVTEAVMLAGLRTYVHKPSLADTSFVSKLECLHIHNQHEHKAIGYDPTYRRPLGERRDSAVLAWTGGQITRFLPASDGTVVPVLVHPSKRGVDFANSIGRKVVIDHDKLLDDPTEAAARGKKTA